MGQWLASPTAIWLHLLRAHGSVFGMPTLDFGRTQRFGALQFEDGRNQGMTTCVGTCRNMLSLQCTLKTEWLGEDGPHNGRSSRKPNWQSEASNMARVTVTSVVRLLPWSQYSKLRRESHGANHQKISEFMVNRLLDVTKSVKQASPWRTCFLAHMYMTMCRMALKIIIVEPWCCLKSIVCAIKLDQNFEATCPGRWCYSTHIAICILAPMLTSGRVQACALEEVLAQ